MGELNQKEVNEQMYLFVKRWLDDLPFEESKKIPVMAIGYCLARLSKQDELLKEQEAVEPKQGKWIYCEAESGQDGYKCSECGFFEPWYYDFENHNFITDYAYCPSCGKPMQEGR